MDIGTFRGVLTAILMVLFIALVIWTYSRRRNEEFEAAAQLALDDDDDLGNGNGNRRGNGSEWGSRIPPNGDKESRA